MQHLEVSCVVRPIYGSLGAKGLSDNLFIFDSTESTLLKNLKKNTKINFIYSGFQEIYAF
jgi:general stress protein 26